LIHSSVGHLGWFHSLTIVNCAAMCIQVSTVTWLTFLPVCPGAVHWIKWQFYL
jgi:hypothetical protein